MNSKLPWKIRKHFIEDANGNMIININDLPNEMEDAYLIVETLNKQQQLKNKYNLSLKEIQKLYKENDKLKEDINKLNTYIEQEC